MDSLKLNLVFIVLAILLGINLFMPNGIHLKKHRLKKIAIEQHRDSEPKSMYAKEQS